MSTPMSPALLLAIYLMVILKVGPNYMKDKKPYQLKNIITTYNIFQVFISLYLVYASTSILAHHGLVPKTCGMDTEQSRKNITKLMHNYLLAKVTELLDTAFFVFRKKDRQISFLHIYHHTLMIIVTWTALKYEPNIHLIFLAAVNAFIHVIMYSYYGLSSFPHLSKYLWWKKYITRLQLVQFVLVMAHFVAGTLYSECKPSYVLNAALFSNGFLFIYLFGTFYLHNYTKKNLKGSIERKDCNVNTIGSHYANVNFKKDI